MDAHEIPRAFAIWVELSPLARRAVCSGDRVGVHHGRATADPALRAGGCQASHRAFVEHVSFQLGGSDIIVRKKNFPSPLGA